MGNKGRGNNAEKTGGFVVIDDRGREINQTGRTAETTMFTSVGGWGRKLPGGSIRSVHLPPSIGTPPQSTLSHCASPVLRGPIIYAQISIRISHFQSHWVPSGTRADYDWTLRLGSVVSELISVFSLRTTTGRFRIPNGVRTRTDFSKDELMGPHKKRDGRVI